MVQPGLGLDTPRTEVGNATYLTQQIDLDISQEASFQSPSKDQNILQQLRNGRRAGGTALRTPRSRVPFSERRNLPVSNFGGGEFTPLLKSATRNSALRNGKENGRTPGFKSVRLGDVAEELSPVPQFNSFVYDDVRDSSYANATPAPRVESSSANSTPLALLPKRNNKEGILKDGAQMSLREQEAMIDKVDKENFGLKLKVHFLEEQLRKSGPGYNEAALKENADLKVDRITTQKELLKYRKMLSKAEENLDEFRRQMAILQEKAKAHRSPQGSSLQVETLKEEIVQLKRSYESKITELRTKLDDSARDNDQVEKLRDDIGDLEAELREKERAIDDRDDAAEALKDQLAAQNDKIKDLERQLKDAPSGRDLEKAARATEELEDAKDKISDFEDQVARLRDELDEAQAARDKAVVEKKRADADLEEIRDEVANKSFSAKGLSKKLEDRANRLQTELNNLQEQHSTLRIQYSEKARDASRLEAEMDKIKGQGSDQQRQLSNDLRKLQDANTRLESEHQSLSNQLRTAQQELRRKVDERDLLQSRHDALSAESSSLQKELARSKETIRDLQDKLDHDKTQALDAERQVRNNYTAELDRLMDEVEDLKAQLRQKDQGQSEYSLVIKSLNDEVEDLKAQLAHNERVYDDDCDNWDIEIRNMQSELDRAKEKALSLEEEVEKLQKASGSLSSKDAQLQKALESERQRHAREVEGLNRQIDDLNADVKRRITAAEELRFQLGHVTDQLRQSQREQKSASEEAQNAKTRIESLQDSLDSMRDQQDKMRTEASDAKRKSEDLQRQLFTMEMELEKAKTAAATTESQADDGFITARQDTQEIALSLQLKKVESQLDKAQKENQDLQGRLITMKTDLHSARTSVSVAEAERNEIKRQLDTVQNQQAKTFRLEEEMIDLRGTKSRLEIENRILQEEKQVLSERRERIEAELQQELDRASAEESRLGNEIIELQRKLASASSDRDSKRTIQRLEFRIRELETQLMSRSPGSPSHNFSALLQDLNALRNKDETHVHQANEHKNQVRSLQHKIVDLERKLHQAEMFRLEASSPRSVANDSVYRTELVETRSQLQTAHQSLRDARSQLRKVERESAEKVSNAEQQLQIKTEVWETERENLEFELSQAMSAQERLAASNSSSETKIALLQSKIDRLESDLENARNRRSPTDSRAVESEVKDLQRLLRKTQIEAEQLEHDVKERDQLIAELQENEAELRVYISRIREQSYTLTEKAISACNDTISMGSKWNSVQKEWEAGKTKLSNDAREIAYEELAEMEANFRQSQRDWEVQKNLAIKARDELNASKRQFKKAQKEWELEKLRVTVSRKEYLALEKKYSRVSEDWEASKLGALAAQKELEALEAKYRQAQAELNSQKSRACISHDQYAALEAKFKNAQEEWEAGKSRACISHSAYATLENEFKAARAEWEAEKRRLSAVPPVNVDLHERTRKYGDELAKVIVEKQHAEELAKLTAEKYALESSFRIAQQQWHEEKQRLIAATAHTPAKAMRSPAKSSNNAINAEEFEKLVSEKKQMEQKHQRQIQGLTMQIQWLKSKIEREQGLRADAAFAKRYMQLQLDPQNTRFVSNYPTSALSSLSTLLTSF